MERLIHTIISVTSIGNPTKNIHLGRCINNAIQVGGVLQGFDLNSNANLLQLVLYHLSNVNAFLGIADRDGDFQAIGIASFSHQLFGFFHIVRIPNKVFVITPDGGSNRAISQRATASVHHIHNRLAIQSITDSLAQGFVVERLGGAVEANKNVAIAGSFDQVYVLVCVKVLDVVRRNVQSNIYAAGFNLHTAAGRFGNQTECQGAECRNSAPVFLIGLEVQSVTLCPLIEDERTGAVGLLFHVGAALDGLLINNEQIAELGKHSASRLSQLNLHIAIIQGGGVIRIHGGDNPVGELAVLCAAQTVHNIIGIQCLTIVELNTLPNVKIQSEVIDPLPAVGKARSHGSSVLLTEQSIIN